jgi:drug/metabolite transporter (DMT)-like permease
MQNNRPLVAGLFMFGSVLAFTTMAIASREASRAHDTFEIMFWRSLIGFVLVLGFMVQTRRLAEAKTRHPGQHLVRNLFHFTGQNLWLWALTLIPMAQVFAIEFTSPLWVMLLAPLLFGEKLSALRAVAAAVGFAGILVVARPDFGHIEPGVLAALGAAVGFASTLLMTKMLTREETVLTIMFWLTLMQTGFGLVMALKDGQWVLPDSTSAPWLALIGLCGVLAHMCLTTALRMAPAAQIMPIDFLRLPLVTLAGIAFYNEPLTWPLVIGGAMILSANWLNLRASVQRG